MLSLICFPDERSFSRAIMLREKIGFPAEALNLPLFCKGLTAPCLVVPLRKEEISRIIKDSGISVSGILRYYPILRDIPESPGPDGVFAAILGELRLDSIKLSVSDPSRLRVDISFEKNISHIIPIIAGMIRGGAYDSSKPSLVFEEEHRLLAFTKNTLAISRADNVLDFWVMLRTSIDLICAAWTNRFHIEPSNGNRRGIGAAEIYRRLPASNCGRCGFKTCMEFAVSLQTGKALLSDCSSLDGEEFKELRLSMEWWIRLLGFPHAGART
jgi:ArsR family metal-binding transcriptional regulator